MILITGAGGKTGRTLIRVLSKMESVCALVRREEHVSVASALGAQKVITGDMRQEATIRTAMEGVRALYHICPNMSPDETMIGELVMNAARAHGVEHVIYHSVLHPQTEKMTHHWQKLRVEEMLLESGLPFTIFQPAPYMQNLLAGWKNIVENGILQVPYSVQARFSFVDLEDLVQAARTVLAEPGHSNATYELAGTPPVSHVEVAEVFARVLQRDVRATQQEIRDWRLHASGLSEYAVESLVRMFAYYDQWGLAGNSNVLKWLLKREPVSFESFIQRTWREVRD